MRVKIRRVFVLCLPHTLFLVICDAANINKETIFSLFFSGFTSSFSSSVESRNVLLKHTNIALKNLYDTNCESKVKAMEHILFIIEIILVHLFTCLRIIILVIMSNLKPNNLLFRLEFKFGCSLII